MYGIDIERVGELMQMAPAEPGNSRTLLTARAEYSLEKLVLHTADEHEISTSGGRGRNRVHRRGSHRGGEGLLPVFISW